MRILWVKADKLLPVQSGGNIRSYHILRRLAARQELTFLSYYSGDRDPDYERELEIQVPGAICVYTGKRDSSGLGRVLDYIVHFPSQTPYAVGRFASFRVRDRLKACLLGKRFDVAVCDFLDAAVNFPRKLAIPTVLFQHNVESEIWRRHALTESNPAKRVLYKVEFAKMRHYEQRTVREFHHIIAVSEHDRRLMSAWVEPSRITVVPTGVYLQQYRPEASPLAADPLVMFVGAMDWQPNIDSVEHFCRQIWPLVQAGVP
ncbi:MAG TPA: glycosyltransferase, partial [Terriglobales bacterium]|nr:glycosyltransferase [Terriglobales bacterium]